jgi:RNA polymerase sigma factor (sigma-70 family)
MVSGGSAVATDEQLVEATRAGSDEAFEALFRRYRDRIGVHVRGMVQDRGRAEDIVQDTFVSALRSLRSSDQEIVFRPWVYQIARNACIDHLRRTKRTEEISIDSDEFWPDFEGYVSASTPETYATVVQRQSLDDLQQAFGGLPDSQYEILVLREFEGLSYQEISRRMRLTPAAVESMLARARRSLKDHFDEIATGERCQRMIPVMAAVSNGLAGKRDRRMLMRHVRHCRSCRQEAMEVGLAALVSDARRGRTRNVLSRAAAFLPLPFLRRRWLDEPSDPSGGVGLSAGAQAHVAHFGAVVGTSADQTASVLQKAAAIAAVAAVAGGGGIVAHDVGVGVPLPKISATGKKEAAAKAGTIDPAASKKERANGAPSGSLGNVEGNHSAVLGGGAPAAAKLPTGLLSPPSTSPSAPSAPPSSGDVPGPAGPLGGPNRESAAPLLGPNPTSDAGAEAPSTKAKSDKKDAPASSDDPPTSVTASPGNSSSAPGHDLELPPGLQQRVDRGESVPLGIQKKLDRAAAEQPVATP